ncbi:hypothetical protein ILUMI_09156, partial [Ignelater luminosus]
DKATDETWKHLMRILRYLKNTIYEGLEYKITDRFDCVCYVDADLGNSIQDRKSITGFIFKLFDNIPKKSEPPVKFGERLKDIRAALLNKMKNQTESVQMQELRMILHDQIVLNTYIHSLMAYKGIGFQIKLQKPQTLEETLAVQTEEKKGKNKNTQHTKNIGQNQKATAGPTIWKAMQQINSKPNVLRQLAEKRRFIPQPMQTYTTRTKISEVSRFASKELFTAEEIATNGL